MHSKRIFTGGLEIEKQLDDLLCQDSPTGLSPGDSKMESPSASPLTSLKSIVLSMDWEINDPILKEFIQELNRRPRPRLYLIKNRCLPMKPFFIYSY